MVNPKRFHSNLWSAKYQAGYRPAVRRDWFHRFVLDPVFNPAANPRYEVALSLLQGGRRLLDVGCGQRPYALIYESLVDMSIGTEVVFSPHGTAAADVIGCAEAFPSASGSFDTILCTEALEHTRRPFQVMEEFARMLKPGGHLLLSAPFIYPVHEAPHDYWRFTAHGLEAICQGAGLDVVCIRPKGRALTALFVMLLHFTVWGLNLLSRFFPGSKPLRDVTVVRLALDEVQRGWLGVTSLLEPKGSEQALGLAAGCFIVATRRDRGDEALPTG